MEVSACPNSTFPYRRPGRSHGTRAGSSARSPFQPKQVRAIRTRIELAGNVRDPGLFNRAIDSKLRGRDLVRLRVADLVVADAIGDRVAIIQRKTGRPVEFDVPENKQASVLDWVNAQKMHRCPVLFPSRFRDSPHLSTQQCARLVRDWVGATGLDPSRYGTHSLRRSKAALIYRETGNLRAEQLLPGHGTVDTTMRSLGVELADTLRIAERIDI